MTELEFPCVNGTLGWRLGHYLAGLLDCSGRSAWPSQARHILLDHQDSGVSVLMGAAASISWPPRHPRLAISSIDLASLVLELFQFSPSLWIPRVTDAVIEP